MAEWTKVIEKPLVSGGTFEERASTIRAMVFGVMLEIAEGKISMYRSDLFHDALWINAHVSGPTTFYWIHRDSGTHIGDETFIDVAAGVFKDASYRRLKFTLYQEAPERWKLIVSEHKEPAPVYPSIEKQEEAALLRILKDRNPGLGALESDGTFTEDDQGNWHPVVQEKRVQEAPTLRKKVSMDSILEGLNHKKEEATHTKDQLEEYKNDIDSAIVSLDEYISEIDERIESLKNLPELSLEVHLDRVSFDS